MNSRVWLGAGALLVGGWLTARVIRTVRYELRDKVALISGGSRGLGLVLARHICNQGGKVALLARDPEGVLSVAGLERDRMRALADRYPLDATAPTAT